MTANGFPFLFRNETTASRQGRNFTIASGDGGFTAGIARLSLPRLPACLCRWSAAAILVSCMAAVTGCVDSQKHLPLSSTVKRIVRISVPPCTQCGECYLACPPRAISEVVIEENIVYIVDPQKCTGCGECIIVCPFNAISLTETNTQ